MLSKFVLTGALIFVSIPPAFAQSYSIITIAGTDHLRDGGPALSSFLRFPSAVAVDTAGNVYISDSDDSRVRLVDGSGIITTFAGIGGAFFAVPSARSSRFGRGTS